MSAQKIGEGGLDAWRVLSCCVSFTGVSITAICLFHRIVTSDIHSFRSLREISISNSLVLVLLLDSWIFVAVAGILIQAVGFSDGGHCSTAIWLCVLAYFLTKLLIYFLLLEKTYAVWPHRGSRMTSPIYRVGFCSVLGFFVVLGLAISNRLSFNRDNGECMIGFRQHVLYVIVAFDFLINVLLTAFFLIPLRNVVGQSPKLRAVTKRNLIASIVSLVSSLANVTSLTALRGQEHAWVCLTSCSTDIVVNALLAFWVTNNPNSADDNRVKVISTQAFAGQTQGRTHNTLVTDGDVTVVTMNEHEQTRPFSIAVTLNSIGSDEELPPIIRTTVPSTHPYSIVPRPDPLQRDSGSKMFHPGNLELPRFSEPWVEYKPPSTHHGDVLIGEKPEPCDSESPSRVSSRFSLSSGFASIVNSGYWDLPRRRSRALSHDGDIRANRNLSGPRRSEHGRSGQGQVKGSRVEGV